MLSRITQWRPLVAIALALYTLAWLVPVYDSTFFPRPGVRHNLSFGWDALLVALNPLVDPSWPHSFGDALGQVFSVISGVTNLVLVAVLAQLLVRRSWTVGRSVESLVWNSAGLNLMWISEYSSLRVGYYLWLVSFVPLAVAIRQRRHRSGERVVQTWPEHCLT